MKSQKLPSFEDLSQCRIDLRKLSSGHVHALESYYNARTKGFKHKFDAASKADLLKISIASTCTCILSLTSAGKWFEGKEWHNNSQATMEKLLTEPWSSSGLDTDNAFTVAFVLEAVKALVAARREETEKDSRKEDDIVKKTISILQESVSDDGNVSLDCYPPSAYLTQLVSRVLKNVDELTIEKKTSISRWAQTEIDRQIRLKHSNAKNADPFQLAYAIILCADLAATDKQTPEHKAMLRTALTIFFERLIPHRPVPQDLDDRRAKAW